MFFELSKPDIPFVKGETQIEYDVKEGNKKVGAVLGLWKTASRNTVKVGVIIKPLRGGAQLDRGNKGRWYRFAEEMHG